MSSRPSPVMPRALPVLVALGALAATACARPGIPDVEPPPDPFVRYPYLQAVTDSSAEILWTTARSSRDALVYWVEGTGDTVRLDADEPRARHRFRLAPLPADRWVGYRVVTGAARPGASRGGAPRAGAPQPGDPRAGAPQPGDPRADSAHVDSPGFATPGHRFRTAPSKGTPAEPTVLVFGDSGFGSESQVELARLMEEHRFDLILHTGDVAYPDGSESDLTQRHFRVYRDLLARTPFFPSVGNHDVRTARGRPFEEAFVLPGPRRGNDGYYYSFDWGPVHFVALDSTGEEDEDPESDLRDMGEQYRWLVDDLADAATDPELKWIVVYLHHPPYSAGEGLSGHGSDEELRRVLTPLFDRYGVDLVLTGHDHHYERTHPLRFDEVRPDVPGTVYVVTGGGGGRTDWRAVGREWFTAVSDVVYHYVTLRWQDGSVVLTAIDDEGEVIDEHEVRPVPPMEESSADSRSDTATAEDSLGPVGTAPSGASAPTRPGGPGAPSGSAGAAGGPE